MHDLSLFLLELVENSVRAGATFVAASVVAEPSADRLTISVQDDGHGLTVTPDQALDPFYTTKSGKHTGLGLSLFRHEVEMADGTLEIGDAAELGGVAVIASMSLSHIDRPPLGDVVTTMQVMAATNPEIEFRLSAAAGDTASRVSSADLINLTPALHACEELLGSLPGGPHQTPSSGDTAKQLKDTRSVG